METHVGVLYVRSSERFLVALLGLLVIGAQRLYNDTIELIFVQLIMTLVACECKTFIVVRIRTSNHMENQRHA